MAKSRRHSKRSMKSRRRHVKKSRKTKVHKRPSTRRMRGGNAPVLRSNKSWIKLKQGENTWNSSNLNNGNPIKHGENTWNFYPRENTWNETNV